MVSALALWVLASGAAASTLIPELSPVHAPAVTRSGDFDGDGRRDDLYLSDEGNDRVGVRVRLNAASGPHEVRVTSLETDAVASGLRVVPAGRFDTDCGSFATDCGAPVETNSDGLMIGLGSGTSVLIHWTGAAFDTDFVHDDQAEMTRALGAMFALNAYVNP